MGKDSVFNNLLKLFNGIGFGVKNIALQTWITAKATATTPGGISGSKVLCVDGLGLTLSMSNAIGGQAFLVECKTATVTVGGSQDAAGSILPATTRAAQRWSSTARGPRFLPAARSMAER